MNYVIACDPGVGGGFALFQNDTLIDVRYAGTPRPIKHWVCWFKDATGPVRCIIEKVHGWEGQGNKDTFTFGTSYGWCKAHMEHLTEEYIRETAPQKWQAILGVPKGLSYDNRKRWIQTKVEGLYPEFGPISRKASDAVAIGHLYLKGELGLP